MLSPVANAKRYAIYFMPLETSELWAFGSQVLGYDAASGAEIPNGEFADLTSEPRRYGFHATLKAPFHLDEASSEDELCDFARQFAATRRAFEEPALILSILGHCIALTNARPSASLSQLADDCVRVFDRFRKPLSAADQAQRLLHRLSPRQIANLQRWGYPFVMEDFTFHMTLSSSLEAHKLQGMHRALQALYAPLAKPVTFDAIAIFVQDAPTTRFRVLEKFRFGAS